MDPITEKIILTIVGTLVGAIITRLVKHQEKLELIAKEQESKNVLAQVDDKLQEIKDQLHRVDGMVDARLKDMDSVIDNRIEPLRKDLADLQEVVQDHIGRDEELESGFLKVYRFRLIRLCKIYEDQGYMTRDQFDQLSELHQIYKDTLHGNGQGEEYYRRAIKQPVLSQEEIDELLAKRKPYHIATPVIDENEIF